LHVSLTLEPLDGDAARARDRLALRRVVGLFILGLGARRRCEKAAHDEGYRESG
jgi:hypothetical protein